jgi:4-amino-4-deoxy-L-arabinose transferase-like glycosyltransferase
MPAFAERRHAATYFSFLGAFAIVVILIHAPYLRLPYFWDEMGQFIPAALDILHDGAWIPHSTVPNVHPPGVMAYLAAVWSVFGYSIPATRIAMLLLGTGLLFFTFLLAIELCKALPGAPAFAAVILLLADPLVYTQSMMAQLDLPAATFTVLGLWLFLRQRDIGAALACVALVLTKETGVLLPLMCGVWLLFGVPERRRNSTFYLAPVLVLAAWLLVLKSGTGEWLGDAGFAHYNVAFALHPVRIALCLLRRLYYLCLADFRWIGVIGIYLGWRRGGLFREPAWKFTWLFVVAHVLLVSVLGGAELERYLVPVLPLLYIAMAAGWSSLAARWRGASLALMTLGLLSGLFLNPPFPFPYENNLAMADFVELQETAAGVLEEHYSDMPIYTAWPLTQALRDPAFGYVKHSLKVEETSDLRASTLSRIVIDPKTNWVLVLYSRTWEPEWSVLRIPQVRRFLGHFYEYGPQTDSAGVRERFGLTPVRYWTRRGQWVEIYSGNGVGKAAP